MLTSAGPQVVTLLGQVCTSYSESPHVTHRTLLCVASWLRHISEAGLPSELVASSPCISLAFQAMSCPGTDETLFDTASDMIVEAIHFSKCHNEHSPLVNVILPAVLQLVPRFNTALADEDEDRARALTRVFAEAGEQYLRIILHHPQEWALPVVNAVLRGASHPEPEVAEITFNFWYVLSEELSGSGRTLNETQKVSSKRLFTSYFLELVGSLRRLVEFPADSDAWLTDSHDDFKRFRYTVGDAIFDSCKVASSEAVINNLVAALEATMREFSIDPEQHWRALEGCIYCLRQSISTNEQSFFSTSKVGEFLLLLPKLPAVGLLQPTCIRTVGTYANWLAKHPDLLPPLLQFVAQSLTVPSCAAAASQAMKGLCDACSEHLCERATMSQLLQMYLGTFHLDLQLADRVDLVSALTFVVSQMPFEEILPTMQAIARPLADKLTFVLQGTPCSVTEVAAVLEQICALLRGVAPSHIPSDTRSPGAAHPSVELLQQLWEVLDAVFQQYGSSSACMEKLCRCYKHTARNCGDRSFLGVVPKLLTQITGWFEQQPHSCFLYVANVCIGSFGHLPQLLSVFANTLRRLSLATFQLLSVESTIVDNPDVVDDYFELCSKVLRKQPQLLLEEADILMPTFQCGCAALHIQHREAGRSVLNFFERLVELCRPAGKHPPSLSTASVAAAGSVIGQYGPLLVGQLVKSIAGALPAHRARFLSPLLRELICVDTKLCGKWINNAVCGLPSDAHADGQVLIGSLFSQEASRDEKTFVSAVETFAAACRRRRIV